MSEGRKVGARLTFFVLAIANVLFFAYWWVSVDSRTTAVSRIEELQINPDRIRILSAAARGPGGVPAKAACLEWGPFAAAEVTRAEGALARLRLPQPAVQGSVTVDGVNQFVYLVREPDAGTVARVAEMQRDFPATQINARPCPAALTAIPVIP